MSKSNNEISREVLIYLNERHPKAVKFVEMVKSLEIEEKNLFKNLFFLEENHLVQLMSSYPAGATYPTIHMVKIREEGLELVGSEEKLDALFPLKGFSSRLDLYRINSITVADLLNTVASVIEKNEAVTAEDRESLERIKELSSSTAVAGLTLGKIFENQ